MVDRMDFTHEQAAAYLAAMIDGEGCVEFRPMPGGKNSWRRRVRITNTSESIIAAIEECCEVLGLHYTKHERRGSLRRAWEINFPGPSIAKLAATVALADDGKRERLEAASRYRCEMVRNARGQLAGSVVTF